MVLFLLFLGLIVGGTFLSKITPITAVLVMIFITHGIYKSVASGYSPAYYVAFAFIFLFIGGLMFALYQLGFVPDNLLSKHGFQFGVLIEAFLLSFALAYRINYINNQLRITNQKVLDSNKLFSAQLIDFQDNERKKVAANLHDSLGQKLMVIKIQLAQLFESFNIQENDNSVKSTLGLLRESIDDVRDISHHLHPHQLERLTLKEALEDVISQSFRATKTNISCKLDALVHCKNKKLQLHIYRVFQEAIKNILTHSNAKNVEFIAVSDIKELTILINDDGEGIDSDWFKSGDYSKAFGLSSIKERVDSINGSLIFSSEKGNGFEITITLPYEADGEEL